MSWYLTLNKNARAQQSGAMSLGGDYALYLQKINMAFGGLGGCHRVTLELMIPAGKEHQPVPRARVVSKKAGHGARVVNVPPILGSSMDAATNRARLTRTFW